ncbi:MAG TPA: galactose oxidase-like domain-containing protein [Longimicrobiales bacterium]|nr:galactose oxidase-like domain-containing protein [Longimicrobiales bacterium]
MSAPVRRGSAAAAIVVVLALLFLHACQESSAPTGPDVPPEAPIVSEPELSVTGSTSGQWSAPFDWPVVAVHAMLLPSGSVLSFGDDGSPQVWNPASPSSFTSRPSPSLLFCGGHAGLPDGRMLVIGGHNSDGHGLANANIYDSRYGTWTAAPKMHYARWYPTATTLADGTVLAIAGTDQNAHNVLIPEVWTGSSWRTLSSVSHAFQYYPREFVAPSGRVFMAGPDQPSHWLSTSGTGALSNGPSRVAKDRDYGDAVMYAPGKILYAGGGVTPTSSAETIDLNQSAPAWHSTGSMHYARRHLNTTVLPTGDVLVTSGVSGGGGFNQISTAVYAAELWSPATGAWTLLASGTVPRGYHSTALLLPDGRVLVAGSGDNSSGPDQRNAELFSPPYLFQGTRPTISSAPTRVGYGQSFTVSTAQASTIAKVSLVRLGATTHAFDENQRFVPLSFTRGSTSLTVRAPGGGTTAPPGYYMLFVLTGTGVPSVAKILRIG